MLIWSGWGILVIPIVAGVGILVSAVLQWLLAPLQRPELVFVAACAGLIAAAAANWWVGRRLNNRPGRLLVDPRTGEQVLLRRTHALFWIRMEYWSIPVLLLALLPVALLVLHLAGGSAPADNKNNGAVTRRTSPAGDAVPVAMPGPLPPSAPVR